MGKLRPVVFILAVCGASLFIVSFLNLRILTERDFAQQRLEKKLQAEAFEQQTALNLINEYQKRYFEIIKRNDVLLISESDETIKKDEKDLTNLFNEVKGKINPENPYILKYNDITQKYSQNTGETTYEMNLFAQEKYNAVDGLLNEVYQAVISILSDEEANALKTSEINWLKQVDEYNKHFEEQGYGTIGYLTKVNYECNMRSFRTLLLMLYLN